MGRVTKTRERARRSVIAPVPSVKAKSAIAPGPHAGARLDFPTPAGIFDFSRKRVTLPVPRYLP